MGSIGFLTEKVNESCVPPLGKFEHALYYGKTGSGKTTCGIYPTIQSRMEAGYGMLIFDEKGKEHKAVKLFAEKCNRSGDILEIGKPWGISINILDGLSERNLHTLGRKLAGVHDDSYWTTAPARMFAHFVQYLRALKAGIVFAQDNRLLFGEVSIEEIIVLDSTPLTAKTVSSLMDVNLFNALCTANLNEIIINRIFGYDNGAAFPELAEGITVLEARINEAHRMISGYAIKKGDPAGNSGVHEIIASGLAELSSNPFVNSINPSAPRLHDLLADGKIIVVNMEAFPFSIVSTILNTTLSRLSVRAKTHNPPPISIIIDEGNRVLDADSDIHNDILRESAVEIIMAAQNPHQMAIKFSEGKWRSFEENFGTILSFDSSAVQSGGSFQAKNLLNGGLHSAAPIFLSPYELNFAELRYQKDLELAISTENAPRENEIAIYDSITYESDGAVLLQDIITLSTRSIPYGQQVVCCNRRVGSTVPSKQEEPSWVEHMLAGMDDTKVATFGDDDSESSHCMSYGQLLFLYMKTFAAIGLAPSQISEAIDGLQLRLGLLPNITPYLDEILSESSSGERSNEHVFALQRFIFVKYVTSLLDDDKKETFKAFSKTGTFKRYFLGDKEDGNANKMLFSIIVGVHEKDLPKFYARGDHRRSSSDLTEDYTAALTNNASEPGTIKPEVKSTIETIKLAAGCIPVMKISEGIAVNLEGGITVFPPFLAGISNERLVLFSSDASVQICYGEKILYQPTVFIDELMHSDGQWINFIDYYSHKLKDGNNEDLEIDYVRVYDDGTAPILTLPCINDDFKESSFDNLDNDFVNEWDESEKKILMFGWIKGLFTRKGQ